jgi:hypothetical protein
MPRGEERIPARTQEGDSMTVTELRPAEERRTRDCGLDMHQVRAAIPGMTYRQLDFWTRSNRITAHHHYQNSQQIILVNPGSGTDRCWPHDQVALAGRIFKMIARGVVNLDAARALAVDRGVLMEMMSELTKFEAELDDDTA